jgi:WS/DGAT/MGAT family acyltransferase
LLAAANVALSLLELLRTLVQLLRDLLELGLAFAQHVLAPTPAPTPPVAIALQPLRCLSQLGFAQLHLFHSFAQGLLQVVEPAQPFSAAPLSLAGVVAQEPPELFRVGRFVDGAATPATPALALLRLLGLTGIRCVQGLFAERPHGTMIEPSSGALTMLERLSPEDSRILALESGAIVGHTCKVVIAERTGDTVGYLRDRIARRIGLALRCRQRIAPVPFHLGAPVWVDDPDFDPARHVRAVPVEGPVGDAHLREIVARLMAERLPRDRPLWAIDVVEPLEGDRTALIWRIHHAMADGQATMAIGSALLWSDSTESEDDPQPPPPPEPLPAQSALVTTALSDHAQALGEAAYRIGHGVVARGRWRESLTELRRAPTVIRRELWPSQGASPLDAEIGRRRHVAFVDQALDVIHQAAHGVGKGVTINDLLLGAVAGGLRRWVEERHGTVASLRVQVPVSMHRQDEAPGAVPNRDSFINIDLPVDEPDARRRVLSVNEQTRARKEGQDAEELYALFADVGHVSKSLFRLAHKLASNPHIFALSVSNVRGPAGSLFLAGGRIERMYSLAEIAPHHALRLSANSFGGRMSIGLCADADAIPDLPALAAGIEQSLHELTTGVTG